MTLVQASFAQGFKVKGLKSNTSDLSASIHSRIDNDGYPCGLIKVQSNIQGLDFDGGVIGDVVNNLNEYWVYLAKGTKEFIITRPHYLPYTVNLSEYGIDAIEAKCSYSLVLKDDKLNEEKCGVILRVMPYEAKVCIDGIKLKTAPDGSYRVAIPKGEHFINISLEGYKFETKNVFTGKGVQEFDVQLESIMAEINITCKNGTAEILIDSVCMGIGGWSGKLMPGKHDILVRQEGCEPVERAITLAQKEQKSFAIPMLQRIKGSLSISPIPDGCRVYIDGEDFGKSPCTINDVVFGQHVVRLELDSCGIKRQKELEVSIKDKSNQKISCEIVSSDKMAYYSKAYELFRKGRLIDREGQDWTPNLDARPYFDSILTYINYLDSDFFRQMVYFPEFVDDGDSDRENICIGVHMIMHYTTVSWGHAPIEPEKAELIVPLMGGGDWSEEIAHYRGYKYSPDNPDNLIPYCRDWSEVIAQSYSDKKEIKQDYLAAMKKFTQTYNSHAQALDASFIYEHEEMYYKCIMADEKDKAVDIYKRYKQLIHKCNFYVDNRLFCIRRADFCEDIKDYPEALFWMQKVLEQDLKESNIIEIEYDNEKIKELKSKM